MSLFNKGLVVSALCSLLLTSCDDLLEVDSPTSSLVTEQVFTSKDGIEAARVGLYVNNWLCSSVYYTYMPLYYSMFSDELKYRLTSYAEYYENTYTSQTSMMATIWQRLYKAIYQSNDFITNVEGTTIIDSDSRDRYLGEALFFRALPYFVLVNSYGDVPLVTVTDFNKTANTPRVAQSQVYELIISDLTKAAEYLDGATDDVTYITSDACYAFLARVYLYMGEWEKAKAMSEKLLPVADGGTGTRYQLEDIDNVFRASSKESIMCANMEGYSGTGTYEGYTREGYMLVPSGNNVNYQISPELLASLTSDPADKRGTNWIADKKGVYYPYKYKNRATPSKTEEYEYQVWFRLAEQYLIRAEANAHLGNVEDALSDVNKIRNRAGVADSVLTSVDDVLLLIEGERQREFFAELGHRWFDLKRTNRIDDVLSKVEWKKWESYKALFPIANAEILNNPYLTQNPGYDD